MEFVTIHDLSRELNTPARVIRYRLINLIAEGKMKEGEDFRRDDFKDDQHFTWKINPLTFMRETGLKTVLDTPPVNQSGNSVITPVNEPVTKTSPVVNQPVNNPPPAVTKSLTSDTSVDNKPSLEREMIDLLKDQIKIKDGQIHEQGEQLKDINDLNVKLTGTMLQQNQKIENLLRLTGGKTEVPIVDGNVAQTA